MQNKRTSGTLVQIERPPEPRRGVLRLDHIDRDIAAALQLDPRGTWRHIATVVGATESTVRRRGERLLHSGVVRTTVVADSALPHTGVLVLCTCRPPDAPAVARALAARDDVRFAALITGRWDVVAEVIPPTHQDLARIILEELPAVDGIMRAMTATLLRNFKATHDWSRDLLGTRAANLASTTQEDGAGSDPAPLDEVDHRILACLRDDGRRSYADVAVRCGITESMARRHVDNLFVRAGVQPMALVDPSVLGYEIELLMWLRVDLARLEEIAAALVQRREVRYVSATSGFGDMVCEVILRSRDDLYPFLTTVVGTLPGVREVDVALELVTLKRAYLVLDQWPLPTHGRHYTRVSDDTTAFGT